MLNLGIDVGGTSTKMALLEDGKALWTGQSRFYHRPDASQLTLALRDAAAGRVTSVDTVGICVPGILNDQRTQVTLSVNVPGLMGLDLAMLVRDALGDGVPGVKVCNDAISCCTDVVRTFDLKGRTMLLALGTGVGAAVLDDGIPLLVDGESPGHFGMLDVRCDHPPTIGPDAGAGSLEGYIGVPALRRRFGDEMNASLAALPADDVAMIALARAIRIGHAMFRPHHVVLAGGVGVRLAPRVDALRELAEQDLTSIARKDRTLRTAADDFHAARGAAILASR